MKSPRSPESGVIELVGIVPYARAAVIIAME